MWANIFRFSITNFSHSMCVEKITDSVMLDRVPFKYCTTSKVSLKSEKKSGILKETSTQNLDSAMFEIFGAYY